MKYKMVSGRNRGAGSSSRRARQHMIRQLNRISDIEVAAPAPELLLLPRKPAAAFGNTRQDSNQTTTTEHAIEYAEPAAFEAAGERGARVKAESTTVAARESSSSSSSSSSSASQEGMMLGCHQGVQPARRLSSPGADATVNAGNLSLVSDATTHSSVNSIPTDRVSCFCPDHEVACGKLGGPGAESKPKRRSARRRSMGMSSTAAAVPVVSEHVSDRGSMRFSPLRTGSSADAKKEGDASDISHLSLIHI